MADGWEVTKTDFNIQFNAVRRCAKHMGVDVLDPRVAEFIEHTANVQAHMTAGMRFYCNALHTPVEEVDQG